MSLYYIYFVPITVCRFADRSSYPSLVLFFSLFSAFFSCSLLISGMPAVYYHGTGSENAGRAYTETPIQHVQRNALRKKCMKSTFFTLYSKSKIHTETPSSVFLSSVSYTRTHSRSFANFLPSLIFLYFSFFLCFSHSHFLSLFLSSPFSV